MVSVMTSKIPNVFFGETSSDFSKKYGRSYRILGDNSLLKKQKAHHFKT
jgi:hypothetical protein